MRSLIGDVKIRNQFVGAIDPYPNFLEKFDTFPQNDRKSWLSYLICGIMMQIIECDEYHFLAKRVRAIDEIAKSKFGTFTRIQNTLKENAEKLASHLKEISKLQDSIRLKEITIEIGINYPPIVVSVKMVFEIEE